MSWSYLHLLPILMSLFKTSIFFTYNLHPTIAHSNPANSKHNNSSNTPKMATIFLSKFLLLLILLLNPHANSTRGCSTFVSVAAARPLEHHGPPKYINLKAEKGNGKRAFKGGSVEACLPKGFRRSSAPSRYINYQPLGSTCSSGKMMKNGPRA